jgi:hypothetical protein
LRFSNFEARDLYIIHFFKSAICALAFYFFSICALAEFTLILCDNLSVCLAAGEFYLLRWRWYAPLAL